MNTQKLIELIDSALTEANLYTVLYHDGQEKHLAGTVKTLRLLRQEVQQNQDNINVRVLRAMHDIGIAAVKEYDPTPLGQTIEDVTSMLWDEIQGYKDLEPLRMDFGKGYPI